MYTIFISLFCISQVEATPKPDARCGSYCLHIALNAMGDPINFGELDKSLGKPSDRGYDLAQLGDEARRRGFYTTTVSTSLANLQRRATPFACIAALNINHFVLLYDVDISNNHVFIIDPPREYSVPIDTFNAMWTGNALLLSSKPLETEEAINARNRQGRMLSIGAATLIAALALFAVCLIVKRWVRFTTTQHVVVIVCFTLPLSACSKPSNSPASPVISQVQTEAECLKISPTMHTLGDIIKYKPNDTVEVRTVLQNQTQRPLDITSLRPSCGCTIAKLGTNHLQPGQSTELVARIVLGDSPDPRSSSIQLVFDSPTEKVAQVSYTWRALSPIEIDPPKIENLRMQYGETGKKKMGIALRGLRLCKRCVINCVSSNSLVRGSFIESQESNARWASGFVDWGA